MPVPETGRPNQRKRTRKAILEAAARLAGQGKAPTLEDVAAEALVSRATVYRYFPSVEALMVESALDMRFPDAAALFADGLADPAARLRRAEGAVHAMVLAQEPALRQMLAHSIVMPRTGDDAVVRQNRRTPLIEAALAPARAALGEAGFRQLAQALALIIGTESMIVCKDVLGIDAETAETVKLWAIDALLRTALAEKLP